MWAIILQHMSEILYGSHVVVEWSFHSLMDVDHQNNTSLYEAKFDAESESGVQFP